MARIIALFGLLTLSAYADEQYGKWYVSNTNPDALYAASVNDSGNVFGQYCFTNSGNCVWLMGFDTACHQGDKYPILANAVTGSISLEVYCGEPTNNGLYRYIFSDFNEINKLVQENERIGFAFPLKSELFHVVRFDLRGANKAVKKMRDGASNATPKSTKDVLM